MPVKQVIEHLHLVPGMVNVYLLETQGGLTLIDTGFPGSADKILAGIRAIGKAPIDVRHIVLTHAHPDHIGSAAALKRETGASVWAHAADAPIIQAGSGFHPVYASPGWKNKLLTKFVLGRIKRVEPTVVDHLIADSECLPFDPELRAFHVPGHCAGQLAFLWNKHGGVLFTADACVSNFDLPPAVENLDRARASLTRLADQTFEIACFGHGRPIMTNADQRLRQRWSLV